MTPDEWRSRDVLDRLRDYNPDVSGMDDIGDAIAEIVRLRGLVDADSSTSGEHVTLTEIVAAQLRARLAVLGWTQTKLATFPGVPSQSHLSQQLKGRRHIDLDQLVAICDALGLEVDGVVQDSSREFRRRGQSL